jgi:hypothetical protein
LVAGRWQAAQKVPGITPTFDSEVTAASCGATGNCLIGGYYYDKAGKHAFLVPETRGAWRRALNVPGISELSTAPFSETTALSCLSAGTCVVGGYYGTSPGPGDADQLNDFVVSETNGAWAQPVTLTGAVLGVITSLSCSSAGNCAAALGVGDMPTGVGPAYDGPAVATERNRSWGPAVSVPGTTPGGKFESGATSVSCRANGDCVIGGSYSPVSSTGASTQAFVADEVNGTWRAAVTFSGIAKLNLGRVAQITSVACASAGNCVAGGGYLDRWNDSRPFLIMDSGGHWGAPITIPGLPVASTTYPASATINALSCPAIGRCDAAGLHFYSWKQREGFVVSQG